MPKQYDFKVEKGVSISSRTRRAHIFNFPFEKMEIGDSFLIDGNGKLAIHCRNESYKYGFKFDQKFTIRKISDSSWRCWRIE